VLRGISIDWFSLDKFVNNKPLRSEVTSFFVQYIHYFLLNKGINTYEDCVYLGILGCVNKYFRIGEHIWV